MAKIRLDADARAALAEFDKLAQAQDDIAVGQDEIAGKSRTAASEEQRLGNLRRKLLRDSETAQQGLIRKLEEAGKALEGVEIDERQLGTIRENLTADYLAALEKEKRKLGEVESELEDVEGASDDAFGTESLLNYENGLTAVAGGVGALIELLRKTREEADRVGDAFAEIGPTSGNLVQLAGGDTNLRDKLFAASDRIFASGVVRSREEANTLTFELQAGGNLKEIEFFSQLAAIDNAADLARSAGLISAGFKGGDSVGTGADIVSKAIAAATPATGVSPSDIAKGVAAASAAAKPFGLTDEELFAGVGIISQTTGDGQQAGTQLRSLLSSLTRRGLADELRGQSLAQILEAANSQFDTKKERIEFLGGEDAARGFAPLSDRRLLAQRLREVNAAQSEGLAVQTIENALSSDRVFAPIAKRAAEARDILLQDTRAADELYADAEQAGFRSLIRQVAGDQVANVSDTGFDLLRFVPGVEGQFVENQRELVGFDREIRSSTIRAEQEKARRGEAMVEQQKKTNTLLDKLNNKPEGIPVR